MINLNTLLHYACIIVILILVYFGIMGVIDKYHQEVLTGNQVVSTQKIASNVVTEILKNKNLSAALSGKAPILSKAQLPVAGVLRAVGAGRLSGPLTVGLTQPHPQQQVLSIGTAASNKIETQPNPSDSATEAAVRKVLADPHTVIHTKVDTTVHISYQNKPFSPVFAVYTGSGAQGAGVTLHRAPGLDLDALLTSTPAVGVGVEHEIKGTSAGLGLAETYNFSAHRAQTEVYAAIHF